MDLIGREKGDGLFGRSSPFVSRTVPGVRAGSVAAGSTTLLILALLLPSCAQAEWSAGFHPPGWIDGSINAEAVYQGDLVVAGSLRYVGGVAVNGIARWDGSRWRPFGEGFDGTVQTLLVVGDTLIAAGSFNHSGSTEAHSVARWDGSAWNPMGAGIRGRVNCLAAATGRIVAGGYFREAGGVSAQNSAVWNGTEWRPIDVPGGASDNWEVTSLAAMGDTIVAVQFFACQGQPHDPDGVPCAAFTRVVAGNGSSWEYDLGRGDVNPVVVQVLDGKLFAIAGYSVFTPPDNFRWGFGVFQWTGSAWAQVGEDLDGHTWVQFLARIEGRLAVVLSYGVFQWDGTAWQKLLALDSDEVNALVEYNGQLVIGGSFAWDDPFRRRLVGWDGSAWRSFGDQSGEGVSGIVRGMARTSEGLCVAGSIDHVGRARSGRWAAWKDGGWVIPPAGIPEEVSLLASYRDSLYALGAATPRAARSLNMARWDGAAWTEVAGFPGWISSLAEYQGRLIAGGSFVTPQAPGLHIAALNGGSWAPLGEGVPGNVAALLSYQDFLYAGGWGGQYGEPPGGISRWDGSSWAPVGDTLHWGATALAGYANGLVACGKTGHFTAEWYYTYSLHRWDGLSWRLMADPLDGPVTSFAVYHGELIAAGPFSKIGDTSTPGIARWDGTCWRAFGGGLDQRAYTLLVQGDSLWIGGQFQQAGGTPSSGIALWVEPRPSIQGLQATWADNTATVSWALPSDPAVRGAVVRSAVGDFPVDPRDGDPLPGGGGDGVFPGSPGSRMEARQPVPPDGKLRFYTAFAYTDQESFSKPAHVSAMPPDLTAPVLAIGLSRAPDSSGVLSVRIEVSEPLDATRITLSSGPHRLSLSAGDPAGRRWIGSLDLTQEQGAIALDATATDRAGNQGWAVAALFAARIRAADGTTLESADSYVHLDLFPFAMRDGQILTVIKRHSTATEAWPEYLVQPADSLAAPASITIRYEHILPPGDDPFRLQVFEDGLPLPSYVDASAHTVTAPIDHLGRFRLGLSAAPVSSRADPAYLRLDPPEPNPFRDATRIRFEVRAEQRVTAVICGVDGRLTRHLLDTALPPGEAQITWDGMTDQETRAPSGIYWCRISGERSDGLVRLVRLR